MSETTLEQVFTDIADAIREKNNTTDTITPPDMAEKIKAISFPSASGVSF